MRSAVPCRKHRICCRPCGGSSIDTAKAVAIMATNEGDWWDYIHGGTGGGKRIAKAGLPIVAIPTTAGTGTEADPFTVITNGEREDRRRWRKMLPDYLDR